MASIYLLLSFITAVSPRIYKIGFLPSMKAGEGRKYAGAFAYAVQQVNEGKMLADDGFTPLLTSLDRDNRLQIAYKDVGGDTLRALREMTDQYINDTISFIGPEDTCFFEAKLAAAWNLPMIAYVSTLLNFLFEYFEHGR